MSENKDTHRSEADAEIEREIREGRKFTLEVAIARMVGPGRHERDLASHTRL